MSAPVLATYGYFVDWDGDGDFSEALEDISEYVLTASWDYGLDFTAPQGRSKVGQIRLKLDNSSSIFSSYNTASPINSGLNAVLPNRLVKITMDTGGGAQTMFQGYLVTILPSPGPLVSVSTAELVAYGPLSQTQKAEVHLAMQTDYRTDQAFDAVLDAVDAALPRTHDTGQTTMSRWFVSRNTPAFSILRDIEDAECGTIRENKVGQIAFESRAHRLTAPHDAAVATFGSGGIYVWDPQQEDPMAGIYNIVEASARTFNESEDMLLATVVDIRNGAGGAAIAIPAGQTKVITVEYPNPAGGSSGVAVETWGIVDLEANTAADLSGTDVTADITPTRAEYADRIEISLENTSSPGVTVYIVVLRVHGTAIVEGDPAPIRKENTTSQGKFGKSIYPNPSRWLTDVVEAEDYCTHVLAMNDDRRPRVTFTLKANYDAAHLAQAQVRDVSDRIHLDLDITNYGLAIDGDFFIESIRHQVNESRLHQVTYQCRTVTEHTWPASAVPYTPNVIPAGVPDDLYVASLDPALHCTFGAGAWKYNENIMGARFRAKYFTTQQSEPVDLRTVAEGGTLVHDLDDSPAGTMVVADNLYANRSGVQYELDSPAVGYWYFAFQFTSKAGDSVWTDGNKTPSKVTDCLPTDLGMDSGPPADWWVEVEPDPTSHRVRVHASRPKVNGGKIWAWVAQIKDISSYGFHAVGTQIGGGEGPSEFFPCDIGVNNVSWAMSDGYRTLTRESGVGLKNPGDANDQVAPGQLILVDVRGGLENWSEEYCRWGTVDTVQGLKSGYDIDTATYFSCATPFREMADTGVRAKTVTGPWTWWAYGYFGNEPNHGLFERAFWESGQHGDTTTEVFVSDWIDVPAAVDLANVGARVWFDNGYSRSDDGVTYGVLVGDTGNPSGAHDLTVLTHADDPSIPTGYVVLQWHRDTSNYKGIYAIGVILSSALPAEGPYATERSAHPTTVLETGTCTIVKGDKSVTVTRSSSSPPGAMVGKVFVLTTADSTLDANVIAEEDVNKIILTQAFNKSGSYSYAIMDRWFDTATPDTANLAYIQLTPSQVANDIEQEVWRTQPIPVEWGDYEVTLYSRNRFGVGTRLTSASTVSIGGCCTLTVDSTPSGDGILTDVDQGRIFSVDSATDYTIFNPTGTLVCGITVLWKLSGTGIPTLDYKFRLMNGETISKSSGRDLLGAIYDAGTDQWDAFWKKGS